jgi:ADP-heptose:LPS heptosyltransferase
VDPSPDSLAAPATRAGIHRIVLCLPEHTTGDMIMLSPLLAALHRDYPGAQVDALVTGEGAATIFAQFPNFGTAFVLPRSCWLRPWSWIRVMRAFRRERYDLAIDQALDDRVDKRGLPACRTSRRVSIGDH